MGISDLNMYLKKLDKTKATGIDDVVVFEYVQWLHCTNFCIYI